MHEIQRHVLFALPTVLGVDLSITNEVMLVWTAAAVTFVLLAAACRRKTLAARGWFQNLFEALVEFIEKEVARGSLGEAGRTWAPFLLTLFFFILSCNLLGFVPLPSHFKSITSDINVTAALALIVFSLTVFISISKHGPVGFLRRFVPAGVPRWIAFMVAPIEVITWLAKPVSMAVRLFANMMVGHYLIFLFIALEMTAAWFLRPLPIAGAVAMGCFELFVCLIQAFIFTMLAAIYIREALEGH